MPVCVIMAKCGPGHTYCSWNYHSGGLSILTGACLSPDRFSSRLHKLQPRNSAVLNYQWSDGPASPEYSSTCPLGYGDLQTIGHACTLLVSVSFFLSENIGLKNVDLTALQLFWAARPAAQAVLGWKLTESKQRPLRFVESCFIWKLTRHCCLSFFFR